MKESSIQQDGIVAFLRKRDYKFVKELGRGACGRTVLLHDDQINEHFVCKKYAPFSDANRQKLFSGFVTEIKLLHKLHHLNVVRVFNYYLYPDQHTGYILMEYVDGSDIDDYTSKAPEQANELFAQAIGGFAYLEQSGILHRDIRMGNIMVCANGTLKIIDLGFGKQVNTSEDFDKSISLNWWCQTPDEFKDKRYDFRTEVYFVGKLFERLIQDNDISHFKHTDILRRMCHSSPSVRIPSFLEIERTIQSDQFFEIGFEEEELDAYRRFADGISRQLVHIDSGAKYHNNIEDIQTQLTDLYRKFMLEREVPNAVVVLRCFIDGAFRYRGKGLSAYVVKDFLHLLKSSTAEKNRIILANLHTKLDAIERHTAPPDDDPF